ALLVPAMLMGCSLPLLVAATAPGQGNFGGRLGRIYAANTMGCVAGAFLAGFLFIPWLGIQATFGIIIAWTLLVGVSAWVRAEALPSVRFLNSNSRPHRLRFFGGFEPLRGVLPLTLVIISA